MSSKIRKFFAMLSAKRKMAFVEKVCLFCLEGKVVEEMLTFFDEHDEHFDETEEEHKLEYTKMHSTFSDKFENEIENFIRKSGYEPKDFYIFLKEASSEDPASFSAQLEVFFSAFDFEIFVDLMKSTEKRLYWKGLMKGWARYFKGK